MAGRHGSRRRRWPPSAPRRCWPARSRASAARASVPNVAGAPDYVLYNGRISTVDANNTEVQALAVRDGDIIATGPDGPIRALATQHTKVINLQGRRVLPGLIDGHLHGMRESYHCWTQGVRLDLVTIARAGAGDVRGQGRPARRRQAGSGPAPAAGA